MTAGRCLLDTYAPVVHVRQELGRIREAALLEDNEVEILESAVSLPAFKSNP